MALLSCDDCKGQVSTEADFCPHCGRKGSNNSAVIVSDVHMSYVSMVNFMVKAVLAAIPAAVIIFIIAAIVWSVLLSKYR